MIVKIADSYFKSSDRPIMIMFSYGELKTIVDMVEHGEFDRDCLNRFASIPSKMSKEEAIEFMKVDEREMYGPEKKYLGWERRDRHESENRR